ncbi:hypothetical protein [Streptomyces sp. NL15-2K]|uniref:hypothetical protein n=1 Tax=Streptomyces sp. NL15-2K TaxID=376149 RepID=UPI000F58C843|nr:MULTISPECIES: hypothetical protein [Actinomycetes]WKX12195.1 hypothetical protein Q4V64_33620 [Kutzneria buriramensis]
MKSLARIAIVGAVAPAAVTSMSTAAVAEDEYVLSHGLGAGVEWVANGDHLYITDKIANGHSAIGFLEYDTRYYYWNRNGQGATRHVNLDLAENRAIAVGAMEGDWEGTATGGLIGDTLHVKSTSTS